MELYIIKFWMLYRKNANWLELQIHGDNVRFQEHYKTCNTLNPHHHIGPDHRYRYQLSDKNAKKGKSN
jgi:hypothetical protein